MKTQEKKVKFMRYGIFRLKKRITKGMATIGVLILISIAVISVITILLISMFTVESSENVGALFNYSARVILTGSMNPNIKAGDVVVIHREESYSTGDIITFANNLEGEYGDEIYTHRIIAFKAPGVFVTKGDANNIEDERPITQSAVIGKVVAVIPQFGQIVETIKIVPLWCYITAFSIVTILFLTTLIVDFIKFTRRELTEEEKKDLEIKLFLKNRAIFFKLVKKYLKSPI